jgi:hypothetical protein
VTGKEPGHRIESGRWPCGCCGKGVGVHSILCVECKKWCHFRCSSLKSLSGTQNFNCPSYKIGIKRDIAKEKLDTKRGTIEVVEDFCYLGNVLDCEAVRLI